MKKLLTLAAVAAIVFACNNKKSGGDSDITGKWNAKAMYSKGKVFDVTKRDSLYTLMMEESRNYEMSMDSNYTVEDSLTDANETNLMLDRILTLRYDINKDGSMEMNIGHPGDSSALKFTGKYTYDKKTKDMTITLDSNVNNKVSKVKATVKDNLLEMVYDDETKYLLERGN